MSQNQISTGLELVYITNNQTIKDIQSLNSLMAFFWTAFKEESKID
jgi:hypothetical protein